MQVIVMLQVASILHVAVVLPACWLTIHAHKLSDCQWGEKSMGRVVDIFREVMLKVYTDRLLLLNYDLIIDHEHQHILATQSEELSEFDRYLGVSAKEGLCIANSWSTVRTVLAHIGVK